MRLRLRHAWQTDSPQPLTWQRLLRSKPVLISAQPNRTKREVPPLTSDKRGIDETWRSGFQVTTADLDAAAQEILNRPLHLSEAAFVQALDPGAAVAARQGIGGAAPEPLSAMLTECRASLGNYTSWHKKTAERTTAAEEALLRRARQLC